MIVIVSTHLSAGAFSFSHHIELKLLGVDEGPEDVLVGDFLVGLLGKVVGCDLHFLRSRLAGVEGDVELADLLVVGPGSAASLEAREESLVSFP